MLDVGWNFSWDDCRGSNEENAEIGGVMSSIGLANGLWSEVILSGEENTLWKGGDAVNVWNFSGAARELSQKFWHFGLKGVAVADNDWDENDWEIVSTEKMLDLDKEDGGGDLINDDCEKHDNNCDGCDNTSCNVSIIYFENLMFLFSVRRRWSTFKLYLGHTNQIWLAPLYLQITVRMKDQIQICLLYQFPTL